MCMQTDNLEALCTKLGLGADGDTREAIVNWLDVGADGMGTQRIKLQDVGLQAGVHMNIVLCLTVAATKNDYCNEY